jgi:Ca-activated chloride channel family protein
MKKALTTMVFIFLAAIAAAAFAGQAENEGLMTRNEAASIVAGNLSTVNFEDASGQDIELLRKLIAEFRDELVNLGVSIDKLDKRLSTAVSGDVLSADAPESLDVLPVGHWAYDALRQLASHGVITGYPRSSSRIATRDIVMESEAQSMHAASITPGLSAMPGNSGKTFSTNQFTYQMDNIRFGQSGLVSPSGAPSQMTPETARYGAYDDNPVKLVARDPLTTFSLDVNTTSYANVRRFLNAGRLPGPDAVRVEELINYFPTAAGDAKPERLSDSPFYVAYEIAPCPWNDNNALLWVSLTASDIDYKKAPPANLVFLVDVSGSMNSPDRLPLAKSALRTLVGNLRPDDSISLVTYAGATKVVLESTKCGEKSKILAAIDSLDASGSTAGAAGIALAYEQAKNGFIEGGINRILLCTDGDFNVGVSSTKELEAMITRERESGVTLSILGFGTDNYNDEMMTRISSVGNGNYSYVDSMSEAQKVLSEELTATFVTMAKDVKAQIEFNPANVIEYRQLGYEKRQLKNEDFNNDKVDAGDVGAGKRLTILYELTLAGAKPSVDPLRYQASPAAEPVEKFAAADMKRDEIAYLKFRWKAPDGDKSLMADMALMKSAMAGSFDESGTGLRFSAAVAAYGQKLRNNPNLADTTWSAIESWADKSRGDDVYRAEFLKLVKLAGFLSN